MGLAPEWHFCAKLYYFFYNFICGHRPPEASGAATLHSPGRYSNLKKRTENAR